MLKSNLDVLFCALCVLEKHAACWAAANSAAACLAASHSTAVGSVASA